MSALMAQVPTFCGALERNLAALVAQARHPEGRRVDELDLALSARRANPSHRHPPRAELLDGAEEAAEGLRVADPAGRSEAEGLGERHLDDLDDLVLVEGLGGGGEVGRGEEVDLLVGEAGRGEDPAERMELAGGDAGLLDQL